MRTFQFGGVHIGTTLHITKRTKLFLDSMLVRSGWDKECRSYDEVLENLGRALNLWCDAHFGIGFDCDGKRWSHDQWKNSLERRGIDLSFLKLNWSNFDDYKRILDEKKCELKAKLETPEENEKD